VAQEGASTVVLVPTVSGRNLSEGVKHAWRDFVKALYCDPAEHLGSVKRDGENMTHGESVQPPIECKTDISVVLMDKSGLDFLISWLWLG